ncbi:MAG TPA: hypothetical protein VG963_05500, partial [Polyangiaceae bacterium]|nr:hypothetical protein [Polyangiaceae bacterium]
TIAFRGPDLGASSPHELAHITRQLNTALMRLGSGWSLFVESQRFRSRNYTSSRWQHPAAWIVDTERSRHFTEGTHFESSYYLTFVWQLPSDADNRLQSFFYEDEGGSKPGGGSETRARAARAGHRVLQENRR